MIEDHYISITEPSTGLYREKGSKFLAYAYPVSTEEDLLNHIDLLKKSHPKARHYCYAYRLGAGTDVFRANDDGEPSGTAGRPILGAIDSAGLSDIAVVVVRYFGGTKLGASGLIQAYKKAAVDSLNACDKKDVYITEECKLSFDYGHMGIIMDVLKHLEIEISEKVLTESPYFILAIRASMFHDKIRLIKARLLNRNAEDINEDTIIPYCTFEL
ncbi:MAG: YigZ family protein [Saprospiraceae bacterium]|nr:YigZ family protein [Saprospiraceae bacterium]